MTKTETLVRLLQSALAGTSDISIDGNYEAMWHQHVLVTIDGVRLRFWMRTDLRRIEEVVFPDVSTIDTDGFEQEHWIPPCEEFPEWHQMMAGLENASQEELLAAMKNADIELAAAREAFEKTDQNQADYATASAHFFQCISEKDHAWERFDAFEPYHYLSELDQDRFEAMLKKLS
jgi:hypothetical protein